MDQQVQTEPVRPANHWTRLLNEIVWGSTRRWRVWKSANKRSLYVHRDLQNVEAFTAWARAQGFEDIADDLHVTILYSKDPVDWDDMHRDTEGLVILGGERSIEELGDEGAVALTFESDELTRRHDEMVANGASHDYDEYLAHVTITLSGIVPDDVEPYDGELVFGPEIFETIDTKDFDQTQQAIAKLRKSR